MRLRFKPVRRFFRKRVKVEWTMWPMDTDMMDRFHEFIIWSDQQGMNFRYKTNNKKEVYQDYLTEDQAMLVKLRFGNLIG